MSAYAVSALVIALTGTAGLTLHSTVLRTGRLRPGMFCFYTNLSNLLATLYQWALLAALTAAPSGAVCRLLTAPVTALSMALCIWVTHLIYHFVLLPDARRRGVTFTDGADDRAGNVIVHYAVPLAVLAQWVLWADKSGLTVQSAVVWLIIPTAYFVFAMLRAKTGKPIGHTSLIYPYPFLDYPHLGAKRFWLGTLGILLAFFALGLLLVAAAQLLA
ncbi:MAG: Pr6Pr family membrane protein [Oscillospiraceae bacterium]|nr:Pr6Pr family membrane protein [Oscillospiraceae bacterium]